MITQVLHWTVFAVYWLGWLLTIRPSAVRQCGRKVAANQAECDETASVEAAAAAHMRVYRAYNRGEDHDLAKREYARWLATHARGKPEPLTDGDRSWALVIGMVVALGWPIVLPFGRVARSLRAPQEVAAAERAELDSLRKQARALGLDFPGDEAPR